MASTVPQACAVHSGTSRCQTTLAHDAMPPQPHSSMPTSRHEAQWWAKVEELRQYVVQHGRLPPGPAPAGKMGTDSASAARRCCPMTYERIAALEAVPRWAWDAQDWQWQQQLEGLRQPTVQHGRLPSIHATGQMGRWANWQRKRYRAL